MSTTTAKHDYHKAPVIREGFLLLFMAFVTFGLYYPAILGEFSVLDDTVMARDLLNKYSWSFIKTYTTEGGVYLRPIMLAFAYSIYKIFGLSPSPFHLFNVLMHFFNGLLLYIIIKKMYATSTSSNWLALTAAMIFLIHPLNVEAVAWISGRTSVIVTFFILLAFYFHLNVQKDLKDYRLWTAALFYLFSLLSYELALAMPLIFIYRDIQQHNLHGRRQILRACFHRWLPYGLALAVYFFLRLLGGLGKYTPESGAGLFLVGFLEAFIDHFSSPLVAIGFYLRKVFWPWPLSVYIAKVTPVARPLYLALGVTFLLTLFWLVWKRRWLGFWGLWFLCGLLAVLPLSFYSYSWTSIAERYVYLSSIAFAASITVVVFRVLSAKPRWVAQTSRILLVLLLFTFGIGTALRAKIWQSDVTLVQDTVKKNPDDGQVNDAYARALMREGREEEAIAHWKKAIALGRVREPSHFLGKIEMAKKNYAAAEKYYLQALWPTQKLEQKRSQPVDEMNLLHKRDPEVYLALVDLHWKMAEIEPDRADYHHERVIHFHQAACKVDPNDAYLQYLLAKAFLRLGKLEEARKHFAEVKEMAPDTYYGKAAAKLMKIEKVSYK